LRSCKDRERGGRGGRGRGERGGGRGRGGREREREICKNHRISLRKNHRDLSCQ